MMCHRTLDQSSNHSTDHRVAIKDPDCSPSNDNETGQPQRQQVLERQSSHRGLKAADYLSRALDVAFDEDHADETDDDDDDDNFDDNASQRSLPSLASFSESEAHYLSRNASMVSTASVVSEDDDDAIGLEQRLHQSAGPTVFVVESDVMLSRKSFDQPLSPIVEPEVSKLEKKNALRWSSHHSPSSRKCILSTNIGRSCLSAGATSGRGGRRKLGRVDFLGLNGDIDIRPPLTSQNNNNAFWTGDTLPVAAQRKASLNQNVGSRCGDSPPARAERKSSLNPPEL
jgi:hypothetical protein